MMLTSRLCVEMLKRIDELSDEQISALQQQREEEEFRAEPGRNEPDGGAKSSSRAGKGAF